MGIVEAIHTTHKKPVVKPGLKPLPHLLWFPLQRAEGAQLSPTVSGCDFFSEIFYHEMDLPFLLLSLCSYQGDKWHFTAMLPSRHPRETTKQHQQWENKPKPVLHQGLYMWKWINTRLWVVPHDYQAPKAACSSRNPDILSTKGFDLRKGRSLAEVRLWRNILAHTHFWVFDQLFEELQWILHQESFLLKSYLFLWA